MNFISKTFNKIFKSGNQQELDKIKPLVAEINNFESKVKVLKMMNSKKKQTSLKRPLKRVRIWSY